MQPEPRGTGSRRAHRADGCSLRAAILILIPAALLGAAASRPESPTGPGTPADPALDAPTILAPCLDQDLDGYFNCTSGCSPQGHVCGDCNDADPLVHPGAAEVCNHRDENCDGVPDEGFTPVVTNRLVVDSLGQSFEGFGSLLAAMGDVTGDGKPDLAVGAHFWKNASNVQVGSIVLLSGANGANICRMVDPLGQSADN